MDDTSEQVAPVNKRKRGRWKRRFIRAAIVLSVILLCVAFVLKDHIRTLASLRRIPGTKAYVMDYYVSYNLAEVRAHGIDVNHVENSLMATYFPKWMMPFAGRLKNAYLSQPIATIPPEEHCSTVVLHSNDGHVYFGRNLDYKHDACLILKIHGAGGTSSVSVLDLHYLNLDRDDLENTIVIRRLPLLFAPYYLQDGMNQYGVAVSDMTVEGVRPPNDPSHPNVIHSTAMRLILDYAKTTDEAIELLKQFNIYFVAEKCHLMIADASGKSTVVEFIDGQVKPTTTHENWQVCTNHQLCNRTEAENDKNCSRYLTASGELANLHGDGNADDVMKVMQSVSKSGRTMWSSVYDLTSGNFEIAYRQQYDHPYQDHIPTVQ
jgi:hypothetical protein